MRSPRLQLAACLIVLGAFRSTLFAQEAPKPDDEAWRKVIEPSRVTVKFENTPLDEALLKVGELTGNQIPLPKYGLQSTKNVTAELKDEPFWKAVRDAQNFFAKPVAAGTFEGKPVVLPMNLTEVAPLCGEVTHTKPASLTAQEFAVFVVVPAGN